MASVLKVDTIQKADGSTPTAADLGIDTEGSIIGYKRFVHTGESDLGAIGSWVNVGQQVTYTPKKAGSLLLVQHTNLIRGDNIGSADCRPIWRVLRNNNALQGTETAFGNYDRGSSGVWHLDFYTYYENYLVPDTSTITWDWQVTSSGNAQIRWNEGNSSLVNYDGGRVSTTIIFEIAQ